MTLLRERIGEDGFKALFQAFNQQLLRLGLLSPQVFADSALVRANVSSSGLEKSSKKVEEFIREAESENDLFLVREVKEVEGGCAEVETKYSCCTNVPADCMAQIARGIDATLVSFV